jgi:UDP-N-acetylglucosamine 2-epimerase (non-hydrolysing)
MAGIAPAGVAGIPANGTAHPLTHLLPQQPTSTSARSDRRPVMVVYGTRPEAIKVAPIIRALHESPTLRPVVIVTGQHRTMLDQVNEVFGIVPDLDLDVHQPGQTLNEITTKVLLRLRGVLRELAPHAVVVQGDTTTAMASAIAAFYEQVPVVHAEAGLRTNDRYSPYPEEVNRRLIGQLASLHLAPTPISRANLLAENIDPAAVVVTGNTVIDALLWTVGRTGTPVLGDRPTVLLTAHRRESWGRPLEAVCEAVATLARSRPGLRVVFPMHRNPEVRRVAVAALGGLPNVELLDALPYLEFVRVLSAATVVLTDSGGIQEEAPSLGKPVLVLRDSTERPEAVSAGTVKLVGTDPVVIQREVSRLLDDPAAHAEMARAVNPYGDGLAADRSVAAIAHYLGLGPRAQEFRPDALIDLRGGRLPAPDSSALLADRLEPK